MSRPNAAILAGYVTLLCLLFGAVTLLAPALQISRHEGDAVHYLDIMARLAQGQWPHADFVTPLGLLSFAPFALFQWLGAGPANAFLWGQFLVAVLLAPVIWHIGVSRMRGMTAYVFATVALGLVMALMYGSTEQGVALSMHYNRWGWAISFCAILLAILAPEGPSRPGGDGTLIGVLLAVLALTKVTFFAAFVLPIAVALMVRGAWRTMGFAIISGLLVAALVTVIAGPSFWLAYAGDLLAVSGSSLRSAPSDTFVEVLSSPKYLAGSLLALAAVVLLRRGGRGGEGLALLLFVPGFVYVSYQNFGNDQVWLALLAILLASLPPRTEPHGGPATLMQAMVMAASAALIAPSLINLAYSPVRNLTVVPDDYSAIVPAMPGLNGLKLRGERVNATIAYEDVAPSLAPLVGDAERREPVEFMGEILPRCTVGSGYSALMQTITDSLHEDGGLTDTAGLFVADMLPSIWLYGPFRPLQHGAPWHYGGLPGWDDADYLLVPMCPFVPKSRENALQAVTESGASLEEVARSPLYILYRKG